MDPGPRVLVLAIIVAMIPANIFNQINTYIYRILQKY